jgi:hypothetical protein
MSCGQCGTPRRGGRFCVGCGRRIPPQVLAEAIAPRPRSPHSDELTQPVLRLDRPAKPAVPAR